MSVLCIYSRIEISKPENVCHFSRNTEINSFIYIICVSFVKDKVILSLHFDNMYSVLFISTHSCYMFDLISYFFSLQEFAGEGLRTLALAYKDLDEDYFEVWMKKLLFASTVIENRDDQLAVLYEEIEQGLKVTLTFVYLCGTINAL